MSDTAPKLVPEPPRVLFHDPWFVWDGVKGEYVDTHPIKAHPVGLKLITMKRVSEQAR